MECDIPLTCDNYNQPLPNDEPCVRGCSCCPSVELNGECIDASLCSGEPSFSKSLFYVLQHCSAIS